MVNTLGVPRLGGDVVVGGAEVVPAQGDVVPVTVGGVRAVDEHDVSSRALGAVGRERVAMGDAGVVGGNGQAPLLGGLDGERAVGGRLDDGAAQSLDQAA